jgi:hypothetical protein
VWWRVSRTGFSLSGFGNSIKGDGLKPVLRREE